MQNFLSPENQHLMNLVIAAPHYYDHGPAKSAIVDFGESRADFDRAVRYFLHSFQFGDSRCKDEMRLLAVNTFDSSIRLYVIMDKAIQTYALYTLARAQHRVDEMAGPQTLRSLRTGPSQPAPDHREIQRLWRGFLLYELFCIMCGMPLISASASNDPNHGTWPDVAPTVQLFYDISQEVREEFLCVRLYVIEQYQLAVNEIWESFRLSVLDMGRRAWGKRFSSAQVVGTTSADEVITNGIPRPVKYLFEGIDFDPSYGYNWTDSVAMLGVPFLQEFLSQDQTARLDFFRATHPFLHKKLIPPHCQLFWCSMRKHYISKTFFNSLAFSVDPYAWHTLRTVGWIFWQSPDRLASMDLVAGRRYPTYTTRHLLGEIPQHLGLRVRDIFVENILEPEDWERIVRDFGTSITRGQRRRIKYLFRSIGNLKFGEVTGIVTDRATRTCEPSRTKPRTAVTNEGGIQVGRKLAATASAPEILWDNLLSDSTLWDNLFEDTIL